MKRRRCGVCRQFGHDRRTCPTVARNPDFYSAGGVVHPIRGSAGYSEATREKIDRQRAKGSPATAKAGREHSERETIKQILAQAKGHSPEKLVQDEQRLRGMAHRSEADRTARETGAVVRPHTWIHAADEVAKMRREAERSQHKATEDKRDAYLRRLGTVKDKQRALFAGTDRMTRSEAARHRTQVGSQYAALKREEAQIEEEAKKAGVRF